jgi:hypothetical protein
MFFMTSVCIIAVQASGFAEILVPAHPRPPGITEPADMSSGRQLLILQAYIRNRFQRFVVVADDIASVFKGPLTLDSLDFLGGLYKAYDGLVDEDQSLTVFSNPMCIAFGVGSESLSKRVRNTIRRNAPYNGQWTPCGMKIVLGENRAGH